MSYGLKKIPGFLVFLTALLLIMAATGLGLFRWLANELPEYREAAEQRISHAVQRPVSITGLDIRWVGWGPEIRFFEVSVSSADLDTQPVLIPEARVGLDLIASLQSGQPEIRYIKAVGLSFALAYADPGEWYLNGELISASASAEQTGWRTMVSVLEKFGGLELIDSAITLSWQDGILRRFDDVSLELSSSGIRHKLKVFARPSWALDESVALEVSARGDLRNPQLWSGQLALQLQNLNPGERLDPWLGKWFKLADAELNIELEAQWSGLVFERLAAKVECEDIVIRSTDTKDAFALQDVGGLFYWENADQGWTFTANDFRLVTTSGAWPAGNIKLARRKQSPAGWVFSADYLNTGDVFSLLRVMKDNELVQPLQPYLAAMKGGQIHQVSLRISDDWAPGRQIELAGGFSGLAWKPLAQWPGVTGLNGYLALDTNSFELSLDSHDLQLDGPKWFEQKLSLGKATGGVHWSGNPTDWRLEFNKLALDNSDFAIQLDGQVDQTTVEKLSLDVSAKIDRFAVGSIRHYLPFAKIKPKLGKWLRAAFVSGEVTSGQVRMAGDLSDFPFQKSGVFEADLHVQNAEFEFSPVWPQLHSLNAHVTLEGMHLRVESEAAMMRAAKINKLIADIDNLLDPVIVIEGRARGDVSALINIMDNSILKRGREAFFRGLSGQGPARLELGLLLPVKQKKNFEIGGQLLFERASLMHKGWPAGVVNASGALLFNKYEYSAKNILGTAMGQPLSINVMPDPKGVKGGPRDTLILLEGSLTSHDIGAVIKDYGGADLTAFLSGQADWSGEVILPAKKVGVTSAERYPEWHIYSDLLGVASDLPAPLSKRSRVARKLYLKGTQLNKARSETSVELAGFGQSRWQSVKPPGKAIWQFERGTVIIGEGAPDLPEQAGLIIEGRLEQVDTNVFLNVLDRLSVDGDSSGVPKILAGGTLLIDQVSGLSDWLEPMRISIGRTQSAHAFTIQSIWLEGQLMIPFDIKEIWQANLGRLHWGRPEALETEEAMGEEPSSDPLRWPSIDFSIAEMRYRKLLLGKISGKLMRHENGLGLKDIRTESDHLMLAAEGQWTISADGAQRTALQLSFKSRRIDQVLEALNFSPSLKADDVTSSGQLVWPGGPMEWTLGSTEGTLSVDLRDGNILSVEPGAGRIFGLLSFSAIPRRLSLDFGDVFDKGFAFDEIKADFDLRDGHAYTNNLVLEGPAAEVKMTGRIGLVDEDYDQHIRVTPSVNSGLAIAGTVVGGPIVGAAIYALEEMLDKPIGKAARLKYHITGSWDDPQVKKEN